MGKVVLYIATSQDGFIADAAGGVDWLPQPKDDHDLEVMGYKKLMERIDIILMGRKSFEQVRNFGPWGWPDKKTYVFSAQTLDALLPCIAITSDNPHQFTRKIRDRKSDKDIWLFGGAELVKSFSQAELIDEIILTLVPKILDNGIPLGLSFENFNLMQEKPLMDGMTQKVYVRKKA